MKPKNNALTIECEHDSFKFGFYNCRKCKRQEVLVCLCGLCSKCKREEDKA